MFKKSLEAKSQQRLSGADRKKLKRTIKERFRNASDSEIDSILPPKVFGIASILVCVCFWINLMHWSGLAVCLVTQKMP